MSSILLCLYLLVSLSSLISAFPIVSSKFYNLSNESLSDAEFISSLAHMKGVSSLADDYQKKYEVTMIAEPSAVLEDAVAITSCHHSESGSGGDMSFSISIGLTTSASLDGELKETYLNIFGVSATIGVSKGFTVSSSYTCNIPKGSRGQIWAQAYAVQAPAQHRVVYVDGKGREVRRSGWSPVYTASVPAEVSPMFSCRTDAYSQCTIPVSKINIDLAKNIPRIG